MKLSLIATLIVTIFSLSGCKKEPTLLSRVSESTPKEYKSPTLQEGQGALPSQNSTQSQSNSFESTTNKGDKFLMQSGEEVDLKTFGLEPYPSLLPSIGKPQTTFTKTDSQIDANMTVFTSDAPSQVADFYAEQIVSHKSKSVTQNTAVIGGITKNNAEVFIVATQLEGKTQISITAGIDR